MYATIDQADQYIESYYSSTSPVRLAWEELFDDDKLVLLNRAEQVIDSLPLRGCALESGKAFPRTPFRDISLEKAKIATIELALHSLDEEASERRKLRLQGVKSYKLGDLSETFTDSTKGLSRVDDALSVVSVYLSEWLGGGYKICPTRIKK